MSLPAFRRRDAGRVSVVALAAGVFIAACGGGGATPTPAPTPSPAPTALPTAAPTKAPSEAAPTVAASVAPTTAPIGSPVLAGSGDPAGSLAPGGSPGAGGPIASAEPTPPDLGVSPDRTLPPGQEQWPTSVVSATIALAAADKEFQEAVVDWQTAGASQDMDLLLAAAQGMAFLADQSTVNAQRLVDFPELTTVGQDLMSAFASVKAAGQAVSDTALAGDAAGFEAAVKDLGAGMAAYAEARGPMIEAAELALIMRRGMLVK